LAARHALAVARLTRPFTQGKSRECRAALGSLLIRARAETARHKKAPDDAGAFELLRFGRDQYFATTGPVQLKR
jgi:hypothetical protein